VLVQAALVFAPGRTRPLRSSRLLGVAIPAGAMVVGVALARAHDGADALTALASVATPLMAAGAGWLRGWRLPLLPALAVAPLYLLAWLRPAGLAGQAASVTLIAGACLAATGLVARLAPPGWLVAGLVLLVGLDAYLVWGNRQVEPAMNTLASTEPPRIGHLAHPLPALQQVNFGSVTMGWLDLAAPALLGLLVAHRARAAVATGLVAGAWGLLLIVTSPIAATPPVLAGLLAGGRRVAAGSPRRTRGRAAGVSAAPVATVSHLRPRRGSPSAGDAP
jgi:hypothetical protein